MTMWMRDLKKKTLGEARKAFENYEPTSALDDASCPFTAPVTLALQQMR